MKKPDLPLTGGCSCGAIRYRIDAFPLLLYACHCTDCQRQSGSAFAMSMPVATDAFHITEGAPQPWRRTSREAEVTSWFCGHCGGRIYGERSTRRQSINVRAGTLDDTNMAASGCALVHAQRPAMGTDCRRLDLSRNHARRLQGSRRAMASSLDVLSQ